MQQWHKKETSKFSVSFFKIKRVQNYQQNTLVRLLLMNFWGSEDKVKCEWSITIFKKKKKVRIEW